MFIKRPWWPAFGFTDPMAVRDPLRLVLPADAVQAAEEHAVEQDPEQALQMPERGPEITETR